MRKLLIFSAILLFGCSSPKPHKSEKELLTEFQATWDSINLTTQNNLPNYGFYLKDLEAVLSKIDTLTNKDSLPELRKLRGYLWESAKLKSASDNFVIYGQPSEEALKNACVNYLQNNVNDPRSLQIVNTEIQGKNDAGWIVNTKYRANNSYGALVIDDVTFELVYIMSNDSSYYTVSKAF